MDAKTLVSMLSAVGFLLLLFVVLPALGIWSAKRGRRKRFERIPQTTTEAQERTRIAMRDALAEVQQNQPPATAPASLSARLAQLDDALQQGLITPQDHAKKRADIIASI
jgi:hypothetical protein